MFTITDLDCDVATECPQNGQTGGVGEPEDQVFELDPSNDLLEQAVTRWSCFPGEFMRRW